ncbi:MAG: aldo/keto reductase [Prevotella sp.]|nr:aldo/keto reductase [Prevotella sp.]
MEKSIKLNNGVLIPQPGFGTFMTKDGEEAIQAVRWAVETGYRHIDTAAIYNNEKGVGEGIRQCGVSREELFVTSKVWNSERGYDKTLKAFDKTMNDLGLDYLDLYLIHWPANERQFGKKASKLNQETWRAMEKLYEEGRIKAIGVSNFMPHHIERLIEKATVKPAVNQIEFHPGLLQKECVEFCKEQEITVEAWSPLGRGELIFDELLMGLAEKYGSTVAQLIIRWVMQHDIVPLVKSTKQTRIEENFQVFDFEISSEDMQRIDEMKPVRMGPDPDDADF